MTHQDAVLRFAELAQASKRADSDPELDLHLSECAECRAHTELYLALQGHLTDKPLASGEEHPSPLVLVEVALLPAGSRGQATAADRAHVASCSRCTQYVGRVAEAERATAGGALVRWRQVLMHPVAASLLAAGVVIAVVGPAAYRGVLELPEVERDRVRTQEDLGRAEARLADATQRAELAESARSQLEQSLREPRRFELHVLDEPERDLSVVREITIAEDSIDLFLALPPGSVLDEKPIAVRYSLRDKTAELWSKELSAGEFRRLVDSAQGLVPLRIPISAIGSGERLLVVARKGGKGWKTVLTWDLLFRDAAPTHPKTPEGK